MTSYRVSSLRLRRTQDRFLSKLPLKVFAENVNVLTQSLLLHVLRILIVVSYVRYVRDLNVTVLSARALFFSSVQRTEVIATD